MGQMLTEKEKAIAFIGQSLDKKMVQAVLSFDVTRFIVLVRLKKILQNLD